MGVFLTRREYRGYGFRGTGTIFLLPGRSVESISKPRDAVPGRGCFIRTTDGWTFTMDKEKFGQGNRSGGISSQRKKTAEWSYLRWTGDQKAVKWLGPKDDELSV